VAIQRRNDESGDDVVTPRRPPPCPLHGNVPGAQSHPPFRPERQGGRWIEEKRQVEGRIGWKELVDWALGNEEDVIGVNSGWLWIVGFICVVGVIWWVASLFGINL